MEFRILGPVAAADGDRQITLGGVKQRSLLALLLIHRNEAVSTDRLVDELWGERPPETAQKTVQVYVSHLRKLLGDGRIETHGHGYALRVEDGELDLDRFEALVERARQEEPPAAAATLREALSLFGGEPLQDLAYEPWAQTEISRLQELRLAALEERIDAELALGRHARLVPELEALVREQPLRERLRAQLMLALYRSGRQADALETHRQGRALLDERLGLEPGPDLRELEQRILRHDPSLAAPAAPLVERARRRRGLLLVVAGAALLLAVAVSAAVVELTRGSNASIVAEPSSVAVIDPRTNRVVAAIPVGNTPSDIAVGAGAVWTLSANEETLSKIDPGSGRVVRVVAVGSAGGVAVGDGSVWVTSGALGQPFSVLRIDPNSGLVTRAIAVSPHGAEPLPASSIAVGNGGVWASGSGVLARIDGRSGRVVERRAVSYDGPVALGADAVWVAESLGRRPDAVGRFDPRRQRPPVIIPLPFHPGDLAFGRGSVWVANASGDTVWRVDARTNTLARSISVGNLATGVAYGQGSVWVASGDGTVSRIDPRSDRVTATIDVGGTPFRIAVGEGRVWVTVD